jgi:ATP-dependent helicase/nuclease subunit A
MTESYLDITKSVMISSPAGSGKTEKLARRYITLLYHGFEVERILAITFTDKAAAEMKERILSILKEEDPELFGMVREKMPRMRISTIHSFCLKLLKRFCIELGIDPSLEVMDSFNADILWAEAIYESLLEDGVSGAKLFHEVIRDKGIKGWNKLYGILNELHARRPGIELGMRGMLPWFGMQDVFSGTEQGMAEQEMKEGGAGGTEVRNSETDHFRKILCLYTICLDRYRRKKLEQHRIDYNDLELLAYEALSRSPEWQNVLYSFDEHTDHILVDEFQDTSSLQWRIIDKLTEEWRSGLGSKRDSGVKPTIFLVGDDKQSIYSFRGANVSIFKNARKRLSQWLGDEYHFVEIKENYRSLPAIVTFVNRLFEKLMPPALFEDWKIEYTPFEATRQGKGNVELLLLDTDAGVGNARKGEASGIAQKINTLHGAYNIREGERTRACSYGDMAVLLRGRTHLSVFEDALRKQGIPFVVVKGIGFYHSPEVAIMKSLLFLLIDPGDGYSLFNVLRSPVFGLEYDSLVRLMEEAVAADSSGGTLYTALSEFAQEGRGGGPAQGTLWEEGRNPADKKRFRSAFTAIHGWLQRRKEMPYSLILEGILSDSAAWQYFHERQRYLNVKKFITLVGTLESKGLGALEMREYLIKASSRADEPKANVNTEGMDAVKLMTIHASKGLQFPMVFLPCMDEEHKARGGSAVVMEEDGDRTLIAYEEDPEIRKTLPLFQKHREKVQEEEKRLFYVGATRAMDYLCMSGVTRKGRFSGKLAYLSEAFGMSPKARSGEDELIKVEKIMASDEPHTCSPPSPPPHALPVPSLKDEMVFVEPIDKDYKPSFMWRDVTEEIDEVRRKHGDDWVILGRAFHRVFEGLSRSTITMETIQQKIPDILRNETMSDGTLNSMQDIIMSDIRRLREEGHLQKIMLCQEHSYSELPIVLQRGEHIYRGRIDRVIVKGDVVYLYDYKTYPVSESELPELIRRYSFQMELYREALRALFSLEVKAFLFFTHESKIVEV